MLRALVLILLCAFSARPTLAQHLSVPGPHFGALSIPKEDPGAVLNLSFDRFTPNGKPTDPGLYNGIERTIGLNFLGYSFSSRSRRVRGLVYTGTLQLGYGHDHPTKLVQDTFHRLSDSLLVPSLDPRNGVLDWALGFEADYWYRPAPSWRLFVGAGGTIASPYREAWAHGGARFEHTNPAWPRLAAMLRAGLPGGGEAFPGETLRNGYLAGQVAAYFPVGRWLGLGTPFDLMVALQQDNGFFRAVDGSGKHERLGSIALTGPGDSWGIEIWNDYFGGEFKDKGPTGGGRIYVRVHNLTQLLAWLP